MNRFAELLDRLAYEPGRNNKLRLITAYFRETPDPDRGYALAALTGALSFKHAKAGLIRDLITDRADPVLFGLSYDYVGDLSETVALMWPKAALPGHNNPPPPTLSEVVTTLRTLGKTELPKQLARWLDELDETGRWALLKLVTGAMRIGISARLAKTAAANLGDKDAHDVELMWPGLSPPYLDLFAWLEGRSEKPVNRDPTPFRPVMLAHAIEDADFANLDPADFIAEWKWDGIRVQAVSGRDERGHIQARLYSRTGEDITKSFPDLVPSLHLPGRHRRRIAGAARGPRADVQRAAAAPQPQSRLAKTDQGVSDPSARLRSARRRRERFARAAVHRTPRAAGGVRQKA